jgi:hypothetical protein
MNSNRIITWSLSIIALLAISESRLQAQTPPAATFEELQTGLMVKQGDTIEVTENDGSKYKGKIAAFSGSAFTITGRGFKRDLTESRVSRITVRRPDKLWNGLLIGAVAGTAASLVAVATACGGNDSECSAIATAVFLPIFAGGGAGIGAVIDSAIKKQDTVFVRPNASTGVRISPILDKQTVGVRLAFKF